MKKLICLTIICCLIFSACDKNNDNTESIENSSSQIESVSSEITGQTPSQESSAPESVSNIPTVDDPLKVDQDIIINAINSMTQLSYYDVTLDLTDEIKVTLIDVLSLDDWENASTDARDIVSIFNLQQKTDNLLTATMFFEQQYAILKTSDETSYIYKVPYANINNAVGYLQELTDKDPANANENIQAIVQEIKNIGTSTTQVPSYSKPEKNAPLTEEQINTFATTLQVNTWALFEGDISTVADVSSAPVFLYSDDGEYITNAIYIKEFNGVYIAQVVVDDGASVNYYFYELSESIYANAVTFANSIYQ